MNACSLDSVSWAECVVSVDVHSESSSDTSHIAAYLTECEDTKLLALELSSCLAVVEVTNSVNEQSENELGYCV